MLRVTYKGLTSIKPVVACVWCLTGREQRQLCAFGYLSIHEVTLLIC